MGDFPTEAIHGDTGDIDRWSVDDILRAIHTEDGNAHAAVGRALPEIARAVDVLVEVMRAEGRWFNVGAGTSGRVGALDAAEIPPTFGVAPERVQAVLAGGPAALARAVEGAEDHSERSRDELRERGLCANDVVVAISASGRTPFTLGAMTFAKEVGARRIAITCDPDSAVARAAEIAIVPEVGPEVIAGSTRMKGGLAQKMVLHLLSTTTMIRLGYIAGNLMSHMLPASEKLRARALSIVMQLGQLDRAAALALIEECQSDIGEASRRARELRE